MTNVTLNNIYKRFKISQLQIRKIVQKLIKDTLRVVIVEDLAVRRNIANAISKEYSALTCVNVKVARIVDLNILL